MSFALKFNFSSELKNETMKVFKSLLENDKYVTFSFNQFSTLYSRLIYILNTLREESLCGKNFCGS